MCLDAFGKLKESEFYEPNIQNQVTADNNGVPVPETAAATIAKTYKAGSILVNQRQVYKVKYSFKN